MATVNIKVSNCKGKIVVTTDKGLEWMFTGQVLPETAIASLVYQTVYITFVRLDNNKDYTISLTMDINEADNQDNGN